MSIDPLTQSYPSWTPYAFAMNRVIDGVDLDGLEYLDAEESFFTIMKGQVWLKPAQFYEVYGANADYLSGTSRVDAFGSDYIGPTEPILQARFSENVPLQKTPIYKEGFAKSLEEQSKLQEKIRETIPTRKDGKLDRRYSGTRLYSQESRSRAARGKVGLVIIALDLSTDAYKGVKGYLDAKEERRQRYFTENSFEAVRVAMDLGKIPDAFLNVEDLSRIANFIFQGTPIENSDLQQVAEDISKNIAKNYRYPIISFETEKGMDNYPPKVKVLPQDNENQ